MRRNPLVSIVLPTHNGSRYLEQAVQSCLDQTYRNWELIIVDDASTDETPALIARLVAADSRIRSIRNEVNQKLPGALNTGFAQAGGEYLTWTSDDNLYRPHALARMVEVLESRPEVGIVYTDYTIIDETGNPVRTVTVLPIEALVNENCIGPCFLYRRSVQAILGTYSEDLYLAEDYDFWLRASTLFQMEPLHEDLYLWRRHSSSLTSLYGKRAYWVACESLRRNLPRLRWASRDQRARGYLRVALAAQAQRDPRKICECVCRAIYYSPEMVTNPVALGLLADAAFGHRVFLIAQRFYRWAQRFLERCRHKRLV